jgi:hypothetical protein
MSIEESHPDEVHLEPADEQAEWEECPCCGESTWYRLIAAYVRGACYVIYCGGCGKPFEQKWNILP